MVTLHSHGVAEADSIAEPGRTRQTDDTR